MQAHRVKRASAHFVVLSRPNENSRLGVSVSKRVAGAVGRNRVKRLVREWYRRLNPRPAGDLVVIARNGAHELSQLEASAELDQTLKRSRGGA